jgi:dTDP-4-dehydrorhamnose reductase
MKPTAFMNGQPKILILGKNGQVGWELCRTLAPLGDIISTDYPAIDFTDADSLRRWIRDTSPQIIVNAAAYTAVDKAEAEPDLCHKINAEAPGILAEESQRLGAWLVHYSTDYVFNGTQASPYTENDVPNPLGVYGKTKLAGDRAIQETGVHYLIFRLCWVYGARGQNFMRTIQRLAAEREQLRVVNDQTGCPTWSRLIAEATALALVQVLQATDRPALHGLYHLCASGHTSWHGFAKKILEQIPVNQCRCREVVPITTAEYPTAAKRPAYSVMSCAKLQRTFGLRLPEWQESLAQVTEMI